MITETENKNDNTMIASLESILRELGPIQQELITLKSQNIDGSKTTEIEQLQAQYDDLVSRYTKIAKAENEKGSEVEAQREIDTVGVLRSFWDSRSVEEKTLTNALDFFAGLNFKGHKQEGKELLEKLLDDIAHLSAMIFMQESAEKLRGESFPTAVEAAKKRLVQAQNEYYAIACLFEIESPVIASKQLAEMRDQLGIKC